MIDQLRSNTRIVVAGLVVVALVAVAVIFLMQWQSVKDEQRNVEVELKTDTGRLKPHQAALVGSGQAVLVRSLHEFVVVMDEFEAGR